MSLLLTTRQNLLLSVFLATYTGTGIHSWSEDLWLPVMFTVCQSELRACAVHDMWNLEIEIHISRT